ncbi:hypothetical protein EDI_340910 [Entamoeba dispar SAW760]|uniref:Uncharacterized protein n=1 Tax=Entamoeba dispar (strain ATCC PRA-260 / SAW760) TaxID=370354 RepID=B0EV26_ENTDS|nr:uncharacterized protein EDI_340910 [Entamoeba dispar SAW760]EDR21609.1 hypothetical protein EDI_340910 [Entamoeba dispar SAW760]|eukprot:EDR21609.1 hypothetical protein EDI_340910 [Entamoeba dispar SAW760]
MKLIIVLLCFTLCFAQQQTQEKKPEPSHVHAGTAQRQLDKVQGASKQSQNSIEFHHNHFVEELTVSKKVLEETRNTIVNGLKKVTDIVGSIVNGKLREVNNLQLTAPVTSRSNIKNYIEALDKSVKLEKETRVKSLSDKMKVHTQKLTEMEKTLQDAENAEKIAHDTASKTILEMSTSASDSLKQAQQNPEHKGDLKDVKIQTSQGGIEVKQTFREEEHKQRKAVKEIKRQMRLLRETAQKEFAEFKENLKSKIQEMFVDSKTKISKVISDALEKAQAEKDAKEESAEQKAKQAAGMNNGASPQQNKKPGNQIPTQTPAQNQAPNSQQTR